MKHVLHELAISMLKSCNFTNMMIIAVLALAFEVAFIKTTKKKNHVV